jgi:hypothetical protein
MTSLIILSFVASMGYFSPKDCNPVLFQGSSFGQYFQILHKTGNYDEMLAVTSESTLKKYGKKKILNFYKEMDFSYPLKLKAFKNGVLYYETEINATKKTIQILVVNEKGECKIYFEKLTIAKPFDGI